MFNRSRLLTSRRHRRTSPRDAKVRQYFLLQSLMVVFRILMMREHDMSGSLKTREMTSLVITRDRYSGQGSRDPGNLGPEFILKSETGTGSQIQNLPGLGPRLKFEKSGTLTGTQNQKIRDSGPGQKI